MRERMWKSGEGPELGPVSQPALRRGWALALCTQSPSSPVACNVVAAVRSLVLEGLSLTVRHLGLAGASAAVSEQGGAYPLCWHGHDQYHGQ
jgi:hypothetical protein